MRSPLFEDTRCSLCSSSTPMILARRMIRRIQACSVLSNLSSGRFSMAADQKCSSARDDVVDRPLLREDLVAHFLGKLELLPGFWIQARGI